MLGFGLILVGMEILIIFKKEQGWGANSLRIVGLTIVLTAGLFLITAGYSEAQITGMIGLLGTIAG